MSSLSVSNVFQCEGAFQEIVKSLDATDLVRVAKVCKSWNDLIVNSPLIWKNLFEKEGIPLVISLDGKARDYKQDFKILYPLTLSGKKIGQFLGKVIGGIPPISEKWVLKLKEEDPFEKGKSIGQNYVFVVVPNLLKRTVDQNTPLAVDQSGNLIELSETSKVLNQELSIPFSLKNLKVLCSYPLRGKENTPIFYKDILTDIIFNECNTCPDKVRVYFMRKHIADQSRKKKTYAQQVELVKRHGFEIMPLRERALFDAIEILDSGTCPDDCEPLTYARSSNTFGFDQVVLGGFAHRAGLRIFDYSHGFDSHGVVPGVPAEVLWP